MTYMIGEGDSEVGVGVVAVVVGDSGRPSSLRR